MSLKAEATYGVFWTAIERFGQQILQAIIFIVLARLLTPDDFGLVAMLVIFFAISQRFIDSGMGQALIREIEITDADRSTVFWFNLLLSFIFYGLLYISAPLIANFYDRPELTSLTRFMGLAIIFSGIAIVQRAEMTQQLEFKKQAWAQVPAVFIAGAVSVTLAYFNYGVWALAVQYVLIILIGSLALWVLKPEHIYFRFDKASFQKLFGFGYKLLLSGLLNTIFMHIYKLVIGKFFAASTLGFFTKAKRLQQAGSTTFAGIIEKVSYSLLSKAGYSTERLRRGYRQIIQTSSFVIFPPMLILIIFAEPIMLYVLGEQWLPAAPFLQILCLSGMLYHLHSINLNVLKVLGRSDLFLKLEIIKKVNVTIAIIVGLQFGIYGLLIGHVISSYVALLINSWYTFRFLNYSVKEQAKDVLRVLLLAVPMVFLLIPLQLFAPAHSLGMLILYLATGILLYVGSNLVFRSETTEVVLGLLSPIIPKKVKLMLNV